MRFLFSTLLLAFAVSTAPAQCVAYGNPCTSSGMLAVCSSSPTVGSAWTIGERSGAACGYGTATPGTMFTLIGSCFQPGLPMDPPTTCAACGGCSLHVLPIMGVFTWSWPPRTTIINIPNDPRLVGGTLCMQDVCVDASASCICISPALQVTFL